jgi:hypothetical protein
MRFLQKLLKPTQDTTFIASYFLPRVMVESVFNDLSAILLIANSQIFINLRVASATPYISVASFVASPAAQSELARTAIIEWHFINCCHVSLLVRFSKIPSPGGDFG